MAEDFDVGAPLPEESSNRTFVIAAGGLGALLVLSMICLAVYALVVAPRQREARATEVIEVNLQNTQQAQTQIVHIRHALSGSIGQIHEACKIQIVMRVISQVISPFAILYQYHIASNLFQHIE